MMALSPDDPRHGTENGYKNLGCRCDPCREASNAYNRAHNCAGYKKDLCACGGPKTAKHAKCRACYDAGVAADHGSPARYRGGCRCEDCRSAANAARRARRAANPEAARAYDREYKRRVRSAA